MISRKSVAIIIYFIVVSFMLISFCFFEIGKILEGLICFVFSLLCFGIHFFYYGKMKKDESIRSIHESKETGR